MLEADSEKDPRTMAKVKPTSRKRCDCGCGTRATHMGLANNICMVVGCELHIRRWVKQGIRSILRTRIIGIHE